MNIRILPSAIDDLNAGRLFYAKQGEGLGSGSISLLFDADTDADTDLEL